MIKTALMAALLTAACCVSAPSSAATTTKVQKTFGLCTELLKRGGDEDAYRARIEQYARFFSHDPDYRVNFAFGVGQAAAVFNIYRTKGEPRAETARQLSDAAGCPKFFWGFS